MAATGDAPLSYQWKKNGTDITGATSATYTIATAASADAATYTVVVTNAAGSATSNAATLTVLPAFTAPVAAGYGAAATGGGSATQTLVTTAAAIYFDELLLVDSSETSPEGATKPIVYGPVKLRPPLGGSVGP